jgi:bifunctional UDP-N-acetylglucosamine pyrophosphorylase/glucosamine-1-phosphate N-acetyltransferase
LVEQEVSVSSSLEGVAGIVLAAGGGSRLKSTLPKVLHLAAGRPLLCHVLAALNPLPLQTTIVVGPAEWELIRDTVAGFGFSAGLGFAVQDPPRGTADALRTALDQKGSAATLLVVPGDCPMLESDTLYRLLETHATTEAHATVLTARVHDPSGYGRIVRVGPDVVRIVEDRDATEAELRIHEINGGVYAFDATSLIDALDKVDRENSQGEYYLSDVVGLLGAMGRRIGSLDTEAEEVSGVNNRSQLAYVSGLLRHRVCERWMAEGVSIVDPRTTYIDATVTIGRDATIHPFTFLEGDTRIAENAEVGPQTRLVDSEVETGATISFAVVLNSKIGRNAQVGPFASIRPGTELKDNSKVGTFVETKASTIGVNSKVPHLSYLGNAELGKGVNIGAGTITCNWDGRAKHATVIEDDAYISSDTMLVAPVHVGERAATGAGAVVNRDVPADGLAVGAPARILRGRGDKMDRARSNERIEERGDSPGPKG